MNKENVNKLFLVLIVVLISSIFLSMIQHFLMAIFLAGIFSALAQPLYRRFNKWFGGRRALASFATLFLIVFLILLPLSLFLGIITTEAIKVGQSVTPWIQKQLSEPDVLSNFLKSLPFYDQIEPYRGMIFQKAGEIVGIISKFLIQSLSSATRGTANFLFAIFIFLYTVFFFLMDGKKLIAKILYYLPLKEKDERLLLDKFISVTRATLKGTAVIGILQGGIAGIAFAVVGIQSPGFWGTLMAVLSILPGIGTAFVWGPAAIILIAGGAYGKGIGLALFCALVVGSIDNFLRPRLVGKDTQMHELLILFGTLGGIILFGPVGFVVGPIVAALFVTVWEIYGVVFKDILSG